MPLTIAEVINHAAGRINEAGIETAHLDAEILLRHLLGVDRTSLFLRLRDPFPEDLQKPFDDVVARRQAGVPVAYLTGEKEFMGLALAVGPGVLVPRPETEILVEWAANWLSARPRATVVDVGTGSGAIVLSLAGRVEEARADVFVGADISAAALAYAAVNRRRLGLERRVALLRGDLLAWCGGLVDLIVANLPYLRPEQIEANPVLRAEPSLALESGCEGLDAIRRLVADLPRVLAPHGALALEIDPSQADTVSVLVARALGDAMVEVLADLAGMSRHVVAIRA